MINNNLIVEGLLEKRNTEKIQESVTKSVLSAINKFYSEQKTPQPIRKKISNILNYIYSEANKDGENNFVGGELDFTKGDVVDNGGPESGPSPELNPSIYEVVFEIKFTNPQLDFKKVWGDIGNLVHKNMKSNYSDFEMDGFSFDMCIDGKFTDPTGYSISCEKTSRGMKIVVIRQVNPFTNESKEHPTAEDGIENVPYIQKRKDTETEKEKKEESGSNKDKNDEDDSNEDGVFGTEIGLPIDKENCESTDISGVSTPTGILNPRKKLQEGMDSSDTKDMTIQCPECGSQLVNVRDADIFHCSDCDYEWEVDFSEEEKERIQRDSMLDNTNDEDPVTVNMYYNNSAELDNMYTNPQSTSRLHEGVASASDLRDDLLCAIAKAGEIEYNGPDFVEVRYVKNPIKDLANILKKKYKVSMANNRISVDGGDEFHYIEITVKPKVGNKDVYVISYDIPM